MQQVNRKITLPQGYRLDWAASTPSTRRPPAAKHHLPLTLFLIFLLLFALYSNFKFPFITVLGVLLSAPVGGLVALWITARRFRFPQGSASSPVRRLGWQTAVVYISYVNDFGESGTDCRGDSQGAILRLRPS